MKLKTIIAITLLSFTLMNCKSKEQKKIEEFLLYSKNSNIEELKKISSKETKIYLNLIYEAILKLGSREEKEKLRQIASSIECTVEDTVGKCSYIDSEDKKHFFDISFINGYDSVKNENRLFIDIDKKYFLNDSN